MSSRSGSLLTQSPVKWHLNYWLNIVVVATLRGEDKALMVIRVEHEFRNIANVQIRKGIHQAWVPFYHKNRPVYEKKWVHRTLASREAQLYLRDIDRMLVNKEQKTRECLKNAELHLIDWEKKVQVKIARKKLDIQRVYRKLEDEQVVDQATALSLGDGNGPGGETQKQSR